MFRNYTIYTLLSRYNYWKHTNSGAFQIPLGKLELLQFLLITLLDLNNIVYIFFYRKMNLENLI